MCCRDIYGLSFIHEHLYANASSFQVKKRNIFNHVLMVTAIYTTSGNHIKGESNFQIKNIKDIYRSKGIFTTFNFVY